MPLLIIPQLVAFRKQWRGSRFQQGVQLGLLLLLEKLSKAGFLDGLILSRSLIKPPELLLGATHYGTAVDLWSAGCILAELYPGKPIMHRRTEVEQLHNIFMLCGSPSEEYWRKSKLPHATIFKPQQPYKRVVTETFKDFPLPALNLMETLLSIDPEDRGSAALALQNEFATGTSCFHFTRCVPTLREDEC